MKPINGAWHEAHWSLGILPGGEQSVAITNQGAKVVWIDTETAEDYPESLNVGKIRVAGENALLLRQGTEFPLRLEPGMNRYNTLEVSGGGALTNLGSGLIVNGMFLVGPGAQIYQEGGYIKVPGYLYMDTSSYQMVNSLLEVELFDLNGTGSIDQYGGVVECEKMRLFWGQYTLHGGEIVSENLSAVDSAEFIQENGTVFAVSFNVRTGCSYLLNQGSLHASNLTVSAFMSSGEVEQNGGIIVVTNQLELLGAARYGPPQPTPARFKLGAGAELRARELFMNGEYGFNYFESSGEVRFSEGIRMTGEPYYRSRLDVYGGTLATPSISNDGAVVDIEQIGGTLMVTNLFQFTGYYSGAYNGQGARPAIYRFLGGILAAGNIELSADWFIASGVPGRVAHSGELRMAGKIEIENAFEELGPLVLRSNSVIELSGHAGRLAFANSSGKRWEEEASLAIVNWNGSAAGRGSEQLRFGLDERGLTPAQLSQIYFLDPSGFPAGEYEARLLETGEIVPVLPPAVLASERAGKTLELRWSGSAILETATDVQGPWSELPSAEPPFMIELDQRPARFFRIVSP